ncbi:MAG TPA: fibronectin type III domain-containing protein, partial [Bacteroidia bacterium]|nr:fibronectin type III domain-containing protein [Bacteroidia bacterium]
SVDHMYNNSKNSPLCKLKRPDRIAPVAAVVINEYFTDSSIILQWRNSSSDDVMKRELIRSDGKTKKTILTSPNDSLSHFTDTSITAENSYTYSILLTDSSGNRTITDFPSITFAPRVIPALQQFTAKVDTLNRKVDLSWSPPTGKVDRYIIYRAKKGEQLRSWKTLDGNTTSVSDHTCYVGNTYLYRIKAVMKSGAETKMVEVEIDY